MGVWIAIFITLVVLGSVLWVKPSPRELTLTKLRSAALGKGLKVRLLDAKLSAQLFPWIDNYREFVIYEKKLPSSMKPKSHKALVLRLSVDNNAHELDQEDPLKKQLSERVNFSLLPSTVEALIISASGIAVVWREYQDGNLDVFKQLDLINEFLTLCSENAHLWA